MSRLPSRRWGPVVLVALSILTLGLAAWQWRLERRTLAQQSIPAALDAVALAPAFALRSPDGTRLSLADLRGKVVLLNFWATWCPPCTAEMPELNALYRRHGREKDFVIVGVDLEEQPEEVAAFAQRHGIAFPLLLDPDGRVTREDFGVRTLPVSVIIDREGRIRDRWAGVLRPEAVLARLEQVGSR